MGSIFRTVVQIIFIYKYILGIVETCIITSLLGQNVDKLSN